MNFELSRENKNNLPYFELNYSKLNGLVPATILDRKTNAYLMTGYMNKDAYKTTLEQRQVTFWSRARQEIWTKGETSGNFLIPRDIKKGCEDDILAIYVDPLGPVCHRGTWTCFDNALLAGISRQQRFNEKQICPYCGK
jgi:phosphoribosyl-AMP cyclohydrolase / phosphoribosyl-ATP pyrophosphohydrolase